MADNLLSCAYTYLAENKYTNCQRKNLNDSSECGVKKCKGEKFLCYGVYKYVNGILEPHILSCNYRDEHMLASWQCAKDKCILYKSHIKSIYECCCYGNFCNRDIDASIIDEETVTTTPTLSNTTSSKIFKSY